MDGLTFLKSLMALYPIPVVIISSLTQSGSHLALRAVELGAVEIVAKTEIRNTKEHLEESIPTHPAIRGVFDRPRHRGAQVLPPRLEKGTAAAVHGTPGPGGKELEVLNR
jgi:two-component system chemotaxis response regulator CheB